MRQLKIQCSRVTLEAKGDELPRAAWELDGEPRAEQTHTALAARRRAVSLDWLGRKNVAAQLNAELSWWCATWGRVHAHVDHVDERGRGLPPHRAQRRDEHVRVGRLHEVSGSSAPRRHGVRDLEAARPKMSHVVAAASKVGIAPIGDEGVAPLRNALIDRREQPESGGAVRRTLARTLPEETARAIRERAVAVGQAALVLPQPLPRRPRRHRAAAPPRALADEAGGAGGQGECARAPGAE